MAGQRNRVNWIVKVHVSGGQGPVQRRGDVAAQVLAGDDAVSARISMQLKPFADAVDLGERFLEGRQSLVDSHRFDPTS